ncbi:MAG TPA: hypothetical protein VNT58_08895 [Gaiellaceae bacterium]|nr:hypothetical protein [Gaiellaceae bacterium]
MQRRTKGKLAAGIGALVAVVGAGGAIAATQSTPEEEREAIVADVAKELGTTPAKVTAAFRQALLNRVDAAVADGRLTKEQGAELKERIRSDALPLFGGRGLGFGDHGGRGHFAGHLDAAAAYLGTTAAALREALAAGDTLAEVARAQGKSVDGLVDALVADERQELARAVAEGRLTDAQRDEIAADIEERVTALVAGEHVMRAPFPGRHGRFHRFGGGPDRDGSGGPGRRELRPSA